MNSEPHGTFTCKVRILNGKEWDPVSRNGVMWNDPEEAEDTELLNSAESFLLVEAAYPLPEAISCLHALARRVSLALPEKRTIASPETVKYHVR